MNLLLNSIFLLFYHQLLMLSTRSSLRVYVPPTGCCIYTLGVASHVLILLVLRWFDVFGGWTFSFGQGLTVVALTLKGAVSGQNKTPNDTHCGA